MQEPRFYRLSNGDVEMKLELFDGIEIIRRIPKDHWHSVIATVSYYGEEGYGFYRAANFHSKEEIHNTCPLVDKPKLW